MVTGVVAIGQISVNGGAGRWATGARASSKGVKPILVIGEGGGSPLVAASDGVC
jgi:hypothetical protein